MSHEGNSDDKLLSVMAALGGEVGVGPTDDVR